MKEKIKGSSELIRRRLWLACQSHDLACVPLIVLRRACGLRHCQSLVPAGLTCTSADEISEDGGRPGSARALNKYRQHSVAIDMAKLQVRGSIEHETYPRRGAYADTSRCVMDWRYQYPQSSLRLAGCAEFPGCYCQMLHDTVPRNESRVHDKIRRMVRIFLVACTGRDWECLKGFLYFHYQGRWDLFQPLSLSRFAVVPVMPVFVVWWYICTLEDVRHFQIFDVCFSPASAVFAGLVWDALRGGNVIATKAQSRWVKHQF